MCFRVALSFLKDSRIPGEDKVIFVTDVPIFCDL